MAMRAITERRYAGAPASPGLLANVVGWLGRLSVVTAFGSPLRPATRILRQEFGSLRIHLEFAELSLVSCRPWKLRQPQGLVS
jgi:hypothetical protein